MVFQTDNHDFDRICVFRKERFISRRFAAGIFTQNAVKCSNAPRGSILQKVAIP